MESFEPPVSMPAPTPMPHQPPPPSAATQQAPPGPGVDQSETPREIRPIPLFIVGFLALLNGGASYALNSAENGGAYAAGGIVGGALFFFGVSYGIAAIFKKSNAVFIVTALVLFVVLALGRAAGAAG